MEYQFRKYTVSQLHNEITSFLKERYEFPVQVEGEITSFKGANSSGHYYFNLKDEKSSISCVLFKFKSFSSTTLPKMGAKVKITGSIETYSNSSLPSKYQIIVSNIEEIGLGDLYQKYMELMEKLSKEGLFNSEYKNQNINNYPKKIGVITSQTGEVIHDILETIKQRYSLVKVILYPTKVQGEDAKKDILNGLDYFETKEKVDSIIIGRGGGSFEDLFIYNDEQIVRKIFSMKTQIISSVGHDKDRPLCDLVADLRASTPTQAATILTPITIDDIKNDLDYFKENFKKITKQNIENKIQDIDYLSNTIQNRYKNILETYKEKIKFLTKQINSLSYKQILNRGFTITMDENNNIISSKNELEKINKQNKRNIEKDKNKKEENKIKIKTITKSGEIISEFKTIKIKKIKEEN